MNYKKQINEFLDWLFNNERDLHYSESRKLLFEIAEQAYWDGYKSALSELKTSRMVAAELGRALSTVNQQAFQHNIGIKIDPESPIRLFTPEDVEKLRTFPGKGGRRKHEIPHL